MQIRFCPHDKIVFLLSTILFFYACQTPQITEPVLELLPQTVKFSCRAISAVSNEVVWASGTGNTVLRTLDGGQTWETFRPADSLKLDFRCLYALDEKQAMVFSIDCPALGLKTEDGGKTWKQVYYNNQPGIFLNSVYFFDEENGVAVGDPLDGKYVVLLTQNGGETWMVDEIAPKGTAGMFAASNGCVQLLSEGKIMMCTAEACVYTYEPHSGWSQNQAPLATGHENHCDGCYGITMLNKNVGFVVGGNYAEVSRPGNVARTDDGGNTWTLSETGIHGFTSSLAAFPGQDEVLIASGSDGLSWSANQGETWLNLAHLLPEDCRGFHALSAARTGDCIFAAGADGKIAKIHK